jgi:hypothetical protein
MQILALLVGPRIKNPSGIFRCGIMFLVLGASTTLLLHSSKISTQLYWLNQDLA